MVSKKPRIEYEYDQDMVEASYARDRIAYGMFLRNLEDTLCFNRDDDPTRWNRHVDFYGSKVKLYYWTTKEDKAHYRKLFKIACSISKAYYAVYRHKRDRMYYRLTSWKLSAFPDTFGPKCLLVFPLERNAGNHLQPSSFFDEDIIDTVPSEYKSDIAYNATGVARVDMKSHIESAGGFLPLTYVPHRHSIRERRVQKLIFNTYRNNAPLYSSLIRAIPSSVTSISFGSSFGSSIDEGVLPDTLHELIFAFVGENQEIHVPDSVRRLSACCGTPGYSRSDWTTYNFIGISNQLEYMNLRDLSIMCTGCQKCSGKEHQHKPRNEYAITTWIPRGLKTLQVCVQASIGINVCPCVIPAGVENLAISIDSGSSRKICFSDCAFPELKTFFFHGLRCCMDEMLANSKGLTNLAVAFVHTPILGSREFPLEKPHSSDMKRVEFDLALRMLSNASSIEFFDSLRSIQMIRPRFLDGNGDALVCGSRSTISFMLDNLPDESVFDHCPQYVTPLNVCPADLRRKFMRVVRIVTGSRVRGFRQDRPSRDRGMDMLTDIIKAADPADVRPSLVALLAPEPRYVAIRTPLLIYPPTMTIHHANQ